MLKGNGSEHISLLSLAIMTGYGSNQKYFLAKRIGMRCNYNVKNTNYTVFRTEFYILSSRTIWYETLENFPWCNTGQNSWDSSIYLLTFAPYYVSSKTKNEQVPSSHGILFWSKNQIYNCYAILNSFGYKGREENKHSFGDGFHFCQDDGKKSNIFAMCLNKVCPRL